ncbi:MAG: hypothetical protein GYA50_04815 [Eubacteriaceae bacterium]|nr:hypothetical protein [Eubacteriaceae bacterium]
MDIGLYHGKQYRIGKFTDVSLHLLSRSKDEGFTEFINSKGVLVENKYIIDIPIADLEDAYELWHDVIYKGNQFEADNIETLLESGSVDIDTDDLDTANKFGFKMQDQYWYSKTIKFKDIEALIEIKEPILKFEKTKQTTTHTIPKEEIMDYVKYIASFA